MGTGLPSGLVGYGGDHPHWPRSDVAFDQAQTRPSASCVGVRLADRMVELVELPFDDVSLEPPNSRRCLIQSPHYHSRKARNERVDTMHPFGKLREGGPMTPAQAAVVLNETL